MADILRVLRKVVGPLIAGVLIACWGAFSPGLAGNSAQAAGFFSLSATDGYPGDTVQINGSGFTANQQVSAYFSNVPAAVGDQIGLRVPSYQPIGQATINTAGTFDNVISFSVPGVLTVGNSQVILGSGDCYVYITYASSTRIEAVAQFFILGPISAAPSNGRIGDSVIINGAGLTTNNAMYLYFSSQKVSIGNTIDVNLNVYQKIGSIAAITQTGTLGPGVSFQIPQRLANGRISEDVHGGEYYIYGTYFTAATTIAVVADFTVLDGQITLQPQTGTVGSDVKIFGVGLRAGQQISVSYDGSAVGIASGDTVAGATGGLACDIIVPDSTAGSHSVSVSDITGNRPEAWFTVKPTINLGSQSAALRQTVQVDGYGFGEAQEVTITVNGQPAILPAAVSTNRRGTFSASFQLAAAVGPATVQVTDVLGNKAETSLSVVASQVVSAITLTPDTSLANPAYVGMQIALDGTGFKAGGTVTVSGGSAKAALGSAAVDAGGSFEIGFKVPAWPAGNSTITASDGVNSASATLVMEGIAPPPPVPAIPQLGSGVPRTTHFAWSDVQDPSGVTYTFQMAADVAFTKGVLEKTGLTQAQYTLSGSEQLQSGGTSSPYYWRVRAVDGAGNQSDWTVPTMFYVGSNKSPTPPWMIFVLIVLGAVLVVSVGLWLRERRRN